MSSKTPSGKTPSGKNARERARQREEQARRRRRDRRLIIAVATALVVLIGGGIAFQAWRTSRAPSAVPSGSASIGAPVAVTDGKPIILGNADAPVTIRLYEDFHCPHCAEFEEKFGPTITAAQHDGTVQVALFPMSFIDQGSATAANAMACAAESGFGEAYYNGLFANHTLQWSSAQLITLADQVTGETTPEDFKSCVEQGKHATWIESINTAADSAGVKSTPTMFVDDQQVDITTLTVDKLQQLISSAAAK